jgi:hypothetical protein
VPRQRADCVGPELAAQVETCWSSGDLPSVAVDFRSRCHSLGPLRWTLGAGEVTVYAPSALYTGGLQQLRRPALHLLYLQFLTTPYYTRMTTQWVNWVPVHQTP